MLKNKVLTPSWEFWIPASPFVPVVHHSYAPGGAARLSFRFLPRFGAALVLF
jgi:hypothetical protein